MKRRIRFVVAYDGTDFHGWQVQPGLATIEGTLEEILSGIEGAPVNLFGSGRTDAGVHALAQVAACDLENPIPPDNLRRAMNRLLPAEIRLLSVEEAAADFHPRYDARAKTYEYRIVRSEIVMPVDRRFVHHFPYPLDEQAMMEAAPLLEGKHDFTAFAASDTRDALGYSKVRTIFSSRLTREGDRLVYRVRGSGFLKHMVRNIMGMLLETGKGNMTPEDWRMMLAGAGKATHTAPARGLFLMSVEY